MRAFWQRSTRPTAPPPPQDVSAAARPTLLIHDAHSAARNGKVLELDRVSASYGPFRALFDVSLSVPANSAVALVGPNGAGKTTVARVCSGLLAPTNGRVRLAGDDITGLPAHTLARRGVAHANEGRSVFASLTVEQNLVLAFRSTFGRSGVEAALDEAYGLFEKLRERRHQIAGSLSGGEQRMLTLARVLVVRPTLLIADELSLGLAPRVIHEVYEVLGRVRDAGTSVVVVEQHLGRALAFADRVVVLDTGEVAWTGATADIDDQAAAFLRASLDDEASP
jgi:branched-chain amino acid transport system ATP-binding protein